ncbi:adhesion G protein-coupled receptor E1-like [Puntigrus tetrazona]|uniref:adhesion G protein-coupled receptor E1-like n=1 Tax=Puntigrus tetrazona TaxID=1606681 RepID=UPI001C8A8E90|nr:adhesion G protein-coupled receptor E1-like [Puntigrus tetrazona]
MIPDVCGAHAQCFNTHGSYYCTCNEGFQSKTANFTAITGECEDINECFMNTHGCSDDKVCMNTLGSYECRCRNGYQLTRTDAGCEDIDECSDPDVCGANADCDNHPGSYSCRCHQGYSNYGNDQSECSETRFCLTDE